jgi:hypothetical protein
MISSLGSLSRVKNQMGGQDSVVDIATRHGLGGRGIESRWGEIFRTYPDRPWGSPNPVQWVPGLSRG